MWQLDRDQRYVYDNWNVVLVLDGLDNNDTLRKYTWGLDLSGTLQGAGGIGGLLACRDESNNPKKEYWYFPDANGNVTQLLDAKNTSLAAHYEYDPLRQQLKDRARFVDEHFLEAGIRVSQIG